ncbi:hypothetical protein EUGRSUZ_K00102 [Eucalyptus grandis]|uniref:Uncharacterized protein n=2 Tax=Eucalyptus grandis TaxID=71139 RepID=A0ACC3IQR4_EUCGR|nr:hypothetical protein EUGRSUZ_K00102 [Eucalyptus grandis]
MAAAEVQNCISKPKSQGKVRMQIYLTIYVHKRMTSLDTLFQSLVIGDDTDDWLRGDGEAMTIAESFYF